MHIKEVGYIVERLADRFRDLGGLMAAQEAAHKTALAELRASFNARTASDEHRLENLREEIIRLNDANGRFMVERNGLLTQVQDLRAALAKEQELHAATALRLSTEAAKMVELTWKIGDWVKAPIGTRGEIVEIGNEYIRVNIPGEQHPMRWWPKHMCTLCDPPAETTEATHDTPEGRSVAESVIRDDRNTEPKPGDTVRLVSACEGWDPAWGRVGELGTVMRINTYPHGPRGLTIGEKDGLDWPLTCVEIVKVADVRKVTT